MKKKSKTGGYLVDAAIIAFVVIAIAAGVMSMPAGPSAEETRRAADSIAAARADSTASVRAGRAAARRHRRDSIDSARAAARRQRVLPSPLTRPVPTSQRNPDSSPL